MNIEFKKRLHQHCGRLLEKKIQHLGNAVAEAQGAANSETKSTAGDKHDTARAMAHLEVEKISKQLQEAEKLKQVFLKMPSQLTQTSVELGCIVKANKVDYYLGLSLGKIEFENQYLYAISLASPLAQAMKGLQCNETFHFNNQDFTIQSIL